MARTKIRYKVVCGKRVKSKHRTKRAAKKAAKRGCTVRKTVWWRG